ncbi:MAG: signal peptidase I [Candidatus Dependentiae bacterium]|jgi:signal peptidase I
MKKQFQDQLKEFFQTYTLKRREWQEVVVHWRTQEMKVDHRQRVEGLMAQIEDYHNALDEMLAQETPDYVRVALLFRQMKKCYRELRQEMKPEWLQFLEAALKIGIAALFIRTYIFGLYQVPTGSAEPNLLVGDRIFGNKMAYIWSPPKRGDLVIFDDTEFVYKGSIFNQLWQKYVGIAVPFLFDWGPANLVKRVVAVPGDTIEGRIEDGKPVVYRNGEKLHESYVNPYPLIALEKEIGFFDKDGVIGSMVPWFLRTQRKQVRYTYVPTKSLEEQPYYEMKPAEVMIDMRTQRPALTHAFTPLRNWRGKQVDTFGPFVVPPDKYWVQGDSRLNSHDSRGWGFLDKKFITGRASCIIFSLDSEEWLFIFGLLKNPWKFFTKQVRWNRFFTGLHAIPDIRSKHQVKTDE